MGFKGMKRLSAQSLGPDDRVADAVRRGKPAVFKVVDPDVGWIQKLHEASPDTVLIGRVVDDSLAGKLAAAAGRAFAERVLRKADELEGLVRWWEGSNEAASGPEAIRRLCEFERAFAERLQAEGHHALVGGFSSGVPEIVGPDGEVPWMGEWELFYPAMEAAHGVHFHEYWHPYKLDDTWNAFRFEKWWPALPEWAKAKWWLVSELGVDGGLAGAFRKGWAHYPHIASAIYVNLLKGYAQTLSRYPRLAAAIYIAGLGADSSWATFDIAGEVLDRISEAWAGAAAEPWGMLDRDPQRPPAPSWEEAAQVAWQSLIVSHNPDFALPRKAVQVLGPAAFALSDEAYFELGGATWVRQLWSDGIEVRMLLTMEGQWGLDDIRVVEAPRPQAACTSQATPTARGAGVIR